MIEHEIKKKLVDTPLLKKRKQQPIEDDFLLTPLLIKSEKDTADFDKMIFDRSGFSIKPRKGKKHVVIVTGVDNDLAPRILFKNLCAHFGVSHDLVHEMPQTIMTELGGEELKLTFLKPKNPVDDLEEYEGQIRKLMQPHAIVSLHSTPNRLGILVDSYAHLKKLKAKYKGTGMELEDYSAGDDVKVNIPVATLEIPEIGNQESEQHLTGEQLQQKIHEQYDTYTHLAKKYPYVHEAGIKTVRTLLEHLIRLI